MLDVCVVVYLNNILIYSEDMESHQRHVQEVLRQLWLHYLPNQRNVSSTQTLWSISVTAYPWKV